MTRSKKRKPKPRREHYASADDVRALDHLSVEDAAAKLGVRPSYVARIRGRRAGAGAPRTVLRLELPERLHEAVRAFAEQISAAE